MTEHPTPPADQPAARPADQPPSVDPVDRVDADPPADEAERQAQDTVRSISRLEESN